MFFSVIFQKCGNNNIDFPQVYFPDIERCEWVNRVSLTFQTDVLKYFPLFFIDFS